MEQEQKEEMHFDGFQTYSPFTRIVGCLMDHLPIEIGEMARFMHSYKKEVGTFPSKKFMQEAIAVAKRELKKHEKENANLINSRWQKYIRSVSQKKPYSSEFNDTAAKALNLLSPTQKEVLLKTKEEKTVKELEKEKGVSMIVDMNEVERGIYESFNEIRAIDTQKLDLNNEEELMRVKLIFEKAGMIHKMSRSIEDMLRLQMDATRIDANLETTSGISLKQQIPQLFYKSSDEQ